MIYFPGSRAHDFTDQNTGCRVSGVSVHFCKNGESSVTGVVPFKASMRQNAYNHMVGTESANVAPMVFNPMNVDFDEKGKSTNVSVAQAPKG